MNKRMLSVAALMVSVMMLSGCGNFGGSVVGAECRDDRDCAPESRCLRSNSYPFGMCTLSCDRHEDCPLDTACVDRSGGVCLPMCERSLDCREDYRCDDVRDERGGGRSDVCVGD